jgi:putative transposase
LDKTSKKLQLIRGDKSYRGEFVESALWCSYEVEISQKPPTDKGFVPQTGRWQVERAFAWCNFYRRLTKDFEKNSRTFHSFYAAGLHFYHFGKIHKLNFKTYSK